MARILFLLLVAPMMTLGSEAHAQAGGIQVAPVMVAMSAEQSITSLRVRNTRARAVAFEIDVYVWTQTDGHDVLTPSRDLLVAPGVFEIAAGGEQVVRLGVINPDPNVERAFRIIMRELPDERAGGLGFTLEMSLPVFVAPAQARSALDARTEARPWGPTLILSNTGQSHVQIAAVEDIQSGALQAPRYLLAGARAEIPLPPNARTIRLRTSDLGGAPAEHLVHVGRQDLLPSVR